MAEPNANNSDAFADKPIILAALCQMNSSADPVKNLAKAESMVMAAAGKKADWIVLPEFWPVMGRSDTDKLAHAEKFGDSSAPLQGALARWAKETGKWIFGGSIPLQSPDKGKVFNSFLVFSPKGEAVFRYDKVHLFALNKMEEREAMLEGSVESAPDSSIRSDYDEAKTIKAGGALPEPLVVNGWKIATGICFDIRFAQFFLAQKPFDSIIIPAAFTEKTRDHWKVLLQARAVENQAFVLGCDQVGLHENGKRSAGASAILDPWGRSLGAADDDGEGIVLAKIEKREIARTREILPAINLCRVEGESHIV